jgi:hypothetical protein
MHPSAYAAIAFSITEERIQEAERRAELSWARECVTQAGRTARVAVAIARAGVALAGVALRLDRSAAGPAVAAFRREAPPS